MDYAAANGQPVDYRSVADAPNTVVVLVVPVAVDNEQSADAANDADDVLPAIELVLLNAVMVDADDCDDVASFAVVPLLFLLLLRNLCRLHCGSGVPPDLGLCCSPSS